MESHVEKKHNPNIAILTHEISCETACLSCGNSWTRKLPFVDKNDCQVELKTNLGMASLFTEREATHD